MKGPVLTDEEREKAISVANALDDDNRAHHWWMDTTAPQRRLLLRRLIARKLRAAQVA